MGSIVITLENRWEHDIVPGTKELKTWKGKRDKMCKKCPLSKENFRSVCVDSGKCLWISRTQHKWFQAGSAEKIFMHIKVEIRYPNREVPLQFWTLSNKALFNKFCFSWEFVTHNKCVESKWFRVGESVAGNQCFWKLK